MDTIAIDWAGPRGVYWTRDGERVEHADTLFVMLAHGDFDKPARIVLEPAFESFAPERRELFIEQARVAGHTLQRVSDRMTPRTRRRLREELWGDVCPLKGTVRTVAGMRADDEYDCRTIWYVATTKHCSPVYLRSEVERMMGGDGWNERVAALNLEAVRMRFADKTPTLELLAGRLGPARELPERLARVLTDSTGRRHMAYATALWLAAREARSRREYEQFLGLHQNGFASMLRSEVHKHGWGAVKKRGVTWNEYRRALREVYHLLRAPSTSA